MPPPSDPESALAAAADREPGLFRGLAQQSADPMLLMTPSGEVLWLNESATTAFGARDPAGAALRASADLAGVDLIGAVRDATRDGVARSLSMAGTASSASAPMRLTVSPVSIAGVRAAASVVGHTGDGRSPPPPPSAAAAPPEARIVSPASSVAERTLTSQPMPDAGAEVEREFDRFLYAVTHDMRAPVRGIAHLTRWISEDAGPLLSGEVAENLGMLVGCARTLDSMLAGLVEYAHAARASDAVGEIDLAELLDAVVCELDIPESFVVETVGPLPTVSLAAAQLACVLHAVIDNAARHHDRDSGTIGVACEVGEALLEIAVSDDGPGIPQARRDRIFDLFQSFAAGRDDDTTPGSSHGVGLAIARRLVQRNGGSIRAEPAGSRGTVIRLTWRLG